ncbi:hypothetical protein ABTE96_20715, partial [Acinetobacter baumannii]
MRAQQTVESAVMKGCGVEGRAVPVERDGPFFCPRIASPGPKVWRKTSAFVTVRPCFEDDNKEP